MNCRQQDDDSDSDSTSSFRRRQQVKMPRFIKHTLDGIDTKTIIINTHRSQYQVLDEVAKEMGWIAEKDADSEVWDILWTDTEISVDQFFKMHEYQKASHFPGISILARKNSLGKNLMKMRKQFPELYNFFPLTWSLPTEFNELSLYVNNLESYDKCIFIVKPEASCQGKGIFLTKNINQLQGCNYVVQRYLQNPLLINKLKFDFRIYVLLAGCDPLRIYVYNQGLARFATEPYKNPKQKNFKSVCIHLTNYSLNKKNPNFVYNQSAQKMDVGHKRSFSSIMTYLSKLGVDVQSIKNKINDLIIKTFISAQPFLSHIYRLSQPNNHPNDMCFQILGFDIILDDKIEPFLLQVNHNPSLVTDTPLDKFIKKKLVKDTLNILNVDVKIKEQKVNRKIKEIITKQNGIKTQKTTKQEKCNFRKICQTERDQFENSHLGGFTKIYPITDQDENKKYDVLHKKSSKLFQEISGIKHQLGSQCLAVEKKIIKSRISSGKNKYYSVKTTPRKTLIPSESAKAKLSESRQHSINAGGSTTINVRKSKLPIIQKGKFVAPQLFYLKEWQVPLSEAKVPIYLKDYLDIVQQKRMPSRHREVRKRR